MRAKYRGWGRGRAFICSFYLFLFVSQALGLVCFGQSCELVVKMVEICTCFLTGERGGKESRILYSEEFCRMGRRRDAMHPKQRPGDERHMDVDVCQFEHEPEGA